MVLGNVDLSSYPFDGPLPENLPRSNASLQIFEQVTGMARREKLSIRQVATQVAGARAKAVIRGSPRTIADIMEEWFRKGACDGFNIMPPFLPGGLDDFVDMVIPELRRRGLFRSEYGEDLARRPAASNGRRVAMQSRRGRAPPREGRCDQRHKTWACHTDDA